MVFSYDLGRGDRELPARISLGLFEIDSENDPDLNGDGIILIEEKIEGEATFFSEPF